MIRHPPRSTLFPTRRSSDLRLQDHRRYLLRWRGDCDRLPADLGGEVLAKIGERAGRSEEHTSELQSRQYLVCRLLLEKKKKKKPRKKQATRSTGTYINS